MLTDLADYPCLNLHLRNTPQPGDTILLMEMSEATPVRAQNIKQWTDRDPIYCHKYVRKLVLTGWQETTNPEMQPYWKRRDEMSVSDGCVYRDIE